MSISSRLFRVSAPACLAFLSACTVDSLVVLRQPAAVAKGETFVLGAVDIVVDMGDAAQPAGAVVRDSVHLAVGLPAGWEVVSAKACAAPHFRFLRADVNRLDTNLRNRLLLDTLGACETRAAALAPDSAVNRFLKGRSILAKASPDSLGPGFRVRIDSVPRWHSFGGAIAIDIPAGSPADTVLDQDDSPALPGPTAFKGLPVYLYVTLKAPGIDTSTRILLFSKTGSLDTAAFGNSSNQDRGALVYRPVSVGGTVTLRRVAAEGRPGRLSVLSQGPGSARLLLPAADRGPASPETAWERLEIRSAAGALVRRWEGSGLRAPEGIHWDGTGLSAAPAPAGLYHAVLTGPAGRRVAAFALLR